jgi:hypothetical protein
MPVSDFEVRPVSLWLPPGSGIRDKKQADRFQSACS